MQQILIISAFICLFSSLTTGLKKGEVAYKLWEISDDVRRFYVTDGSVIIKATTSKILDDMTSCSLSWNTKKSQKLLESPGVVLENIGENQIMLMKQRCGLYQTRVQRTTNTDSIDSFNHDLVKNKPFDGDFETGAPSGAGSHFAIFPGTKWCGYENVAEDMHDLGIHNATDACCRTHDHCPYYIDRFETKYHYFNHDPWTLSHCECDQHLYDCLKKVNTPTSKTVGKLFFGLLDVQCFTFKAGEYCSSESILSHLWCSKKNKGMMAVLQQFPHKWSDDIDSDETSTDLLSACKDYKERRNIRNAIREIKGLKLDGNDIITHSFGSKSVKEISLNTFSRKEQLPLKPSAINNDFNGDKNTCHSNFTSRIFDSNEDNGFNSEKERSNQRNHRSHVNKNQKPQFRSYLYAGTLSSSKTSPRGKKDCRCPRKVHTAITRIKVLDKSDLVDKCTETADGEIDTQPEIKINETESQNHTKLKTAERKENIKKIESKHLLRNQTKVKDCAIEFSGDLEKVKQTSVLHRPVSLYLSSPNCDNAIESQKSFGIFSPRKPRKIVSYRRSAFTAGEKLNPVSSTISRARLQSAPPAVNKSHESFEVSDTQEENIINTTGFATPENLHTTADTTHIIKGTQEFNEQICKKAKENNTECVDNSTEKPVVISESLYSAKPIEIKRESEAAEESFVARLRSKLDSKRSRDFKSDLQDFSVFTHKMKEKHDRSHNYEIKQIVLSAVKTDSEVNTEENKVSSDVNIVSYHANNKTLTMDEKSLQKKKSGLSRKNRIDSDEHKQYRKYRKKNKDGDRNAENQSPCVLENKIVSPCDKKTSLVEMSPRNIGKPGSGRRKLPEIPVKHDSEPEDDETVQQGTNRLLQERKNERKAKTSCMKNKEKEPAEKIVHKSKLSPADLRKTLELELERSDSKRKAYRVRRELQLLNRENVLKSVVGKEFNADTDTIILSDKTDNETSTILSPKIGIKSDKENEGKVLQRSKSDIVKRRRAVSETDILMNAQLDSFDGEEGEKSVLKMFEYEEPLTPLGKIELIGTLMQEEAKLQEMLRKSSSFNEKRRMRVEVRRLRQRRIALEGPLEQPPVSALQRSASVTTGVVTQATPIYIAASRTVGDQQPAEDLNQSSIDELRRKLGEAQDYDEKKKIRLALRQLRQKNREGTHSALQRSQSFVHPKSSDQATNVKNGQTVLRSQSVTDKCDHNNEVLTRDIKGSTCSSLENDDITHHTKEKNIHSKVISKESKSPVPRTVHRHSSLRETGQKGSENSNKVAPTKSENTISHVSKFSYNKLKSAVNGNVKRAESDHRKSGNTGLSDDELNNDGLSDKPSSKDNVKHLTQSENSRSTGNKKHFEFLKDTVSKLEGFRKEKILEKCEIFEKGGVRDSNKEATSVFKKLDSRTEKTKPRTPHILVSRADVEKNKQNALISLRSNRSKCVPQIHSEHLNTSTSIANKQNAHKSERSLENEERTKLNSDNLIVNSGLEIKDNAKCCESNKNLDPAIEIDSRLSPSLLWLEEKRKSLPLPNDIDKLMSTMDIEAAFSEILGAVEEFQGQNDTEDVETGNIPIVEEDNCDSTEMEENEEVCTCEKNGEKPKTEQRSDENVNSVVNMSETRDRKDYIRKSETHHDGDGDSAIQQTSGNKKSEAKIQLSRNLCLDISSKPEENGAISVIHGEDGTVTVQEVRHVEEGDTTITEWKKLRRTQSQTETHETDTVIEKKITSPGGSSSVYEKDILKTKHKLTSRGSNYFTRNNYNIKRKKDLDGTEVVEHDLSSVSENMSVSKNETWGDKCEAKVVLNRDPGDSVNLSVKPIQDTAFIEKPEQKYRALCQSEDSHHLSVVHEHLGRPEGSPEVKATLKETSAVDGETVILECTVISSPVPSITWFKGDNLLTDEYIGIRKDFYPDTGKACLEIHQASDKDAGEYKCVFENPLGTASTNGKLFIKKKTSGVPSFITELNDVTVNEGHSLCLECTVSNTDSVIWYKNGVIQRNNTDFKQTFDSTKAKLEIVEIFPEDSGTYSCVLKNADGEKRSSCKVTVAESKSSDVVFPVFLKKPETTIANERDPVIIDCEVIGSPQPTVSWYCDGSKVIEDSRHRMSYDGRVAMLVVRRVAVDDSGKLECVAENSSGKVSADCHLVIKAQKAAPSVREPLSDITVASGRDTLLRCVIRGEPKPDVTWRKNGLVIGQMLDFKQIYKNDEAVLEISKICSKDAGCYECTASNEKGEISTSCQLIVQDEQVPLQKSLTEKKIQPHVTVHEETVQTAAVETFTSTSIPKGDNEQFAKSQASKVMLVRQGSLRSLMQEKLEKPLVRTGSLQSVVFFEKSNDSRKSTDSVKLNKMEHSSKSNSEKSNIKNKNLIEITDISKGTVDVNKNYAANLNTDIPQPDNDSGNVKESITDTEEGVKTVKSGSELSSLCLESFSMKEVKPMAKFRAGGEIRRTQSVRTPGSEKPEWLQVKLKKVGSKQSPLALESEQLKTQPNNSSDQLNIVQNESPVCVQKETKLSHSQSARVFDKSVALRDSTNSPSNQPNKDSLKLTPVSERAKIFQMRDSSSSSSGKSSPVDIIAKAINLSRAESMRSSVGNRFEGVQRSQSFKTETPSTRQGNVSLELTPQKFLVKDSKSESGSAGKAIKYWDPSTPSSGNMDYSTITDEEELTVLLTKSENFEERKKIRARIKEVRDKHMKEWEAKRAAREAEREDPIKRKHREAELMKQQKLKQFEKQAAEHHESKHLDMAEQQLRERVRLADEEKKRTLKEYAERGATHQESLHLEISERALQEKIKQADILKKKTLDSYDQAAGKTGMSQTSTVKTEVSTDGKTVTTTRKVETVTKVGGATGKPAEEIAPQLAEKIVKAVPNVSGVLTVKTESWSSKDNVTHTSEKTESWGGRGGAMNAFKAMDAKNAPKTNLAPGAGRANITRSPSAIKTMLLEWCKAMTREYVDIIEITNFSTSWNNGLAFCALIHHFYPDAFDMKSLDPKERRKNFELAFDTAEKLADIAPLLDVEDMVRMQKPDWKCVFTYVQSFYRKLNAHERNKAVA